MYTGLYTAAAGSVAQEKRLAILTNNLANVNTAGFKFDQALFSGVPVANVVGEVVVSEGAAPVVSSVDPLMNIHTPQHPEVTTRTDFSQGTLRETGNPLDVALEGRGFFVIEDANGGLFYTRQGTFTINSDGLLVTPNGLLVQGESGPLRVDGGRLDIDASGRVRIDGVFRDQLKVVDFAQPYLLEKMGDAQFRVMRPEVTPEPAADVAVRQGAIELSNSPMVRLMGAIIETARAYEAYQRVIQIFDDTAGRAVNDIART
jgi:flagellar basal-body rod protein FlgG